MERKKLHVLITGKPGWATRKMVSEYVLRTYRESLKPATGTVLKTYACPKCGKPIALKVPSG